MLGLGRRLENGVHSRFGGERPSRCGRNDYLPLTLESPYGTSILEKRPERIAAIVPNAVDTEMLLALGVKPVLSSSMVKESASQSYLLPYGAEDLDTFEFAMGGTLPVEAIAASEPDLIVASAGPTAWVVCPWATTTSVCHPSHRL